MTSPPPVDAPADEIGPESIGLRVAVVEVERHAAASGWDQPAQLFALVETAELARAEPELAAELGITDGIADPFTPVEQELDDHVGSLEELLGGITWPETVAGALAVVERIVLPPEAEESVPVDADQAATYAAEHPDREEVRIAVGVLRSGQAHCVLRMRSHDDDESVIHGSEVVPALVAALRETLE